MNHIIHKETHKQLSIERVTMLKRIANLTEEIVNQLVKDKCLTNALKMTDNELTKLMFETQLERTCAISAREKRKITRLNEGAIKFAEQLKALGGTCRASQAAEILGVKRQTINNRLKANKLLAVKVGGEYRLPIFQFDGNRLVDGLEEILILLSDFSSTTKVSFLTSLYFFKDENDLNVIDILKKYGRMSDQMQEICRQAKLFAQQESH
ncbi:MAG TPA: DNA-binding protein [Proteus sp.]|nr:DNA-binding protein [Proteus sp. (in: enterobacteria)]